MSSCEISRTHDTLGRAVGLSLDDSYGVSYSYDTCGRLAAVTAPVGTVSFSTAYSRLPASGGLEATSFSIQNSTFSIQRSYEPHRDLLSAVSNRWNSTPVSTFAYANDALDNYGETPAP